MHKGTDYQNFTITTVLMLCKLDHLEIIICRRFEVHVHKFHKENIGRLRDFMFGKFCRT